MSTLRTEPEPREQTRARYPDDAGFVEREGVRVFWEAYGAGEQTVLLLPTWEIVHSRVWKCQIPYLARSFRVVTFDPPGNGRSDRPLEVSAYDRRETAADAIAVLDLLGVERAAVVSWCAGVGILLAAENPERVSALVDIAPDLPLTEEPADETGHRFDEVLGTDDGWAKWNRHYWLRNWPGFVEFFFAEAFTEPHSTKQIEDAIGWGLQTDPQTILRGMEADWPDREQALDLCARVRCPVLVVQGTADGIVGAARGPAVASAIPGARLLTLEGAGHAPHLREPARFNRELSRFIGAPPQAARTWTPGRSRPKRVLYVSSPIGLGHAQRDVAVARELRHRVPGLEIDWLAQHPVTTVLDAEGERIHPASRWLASESGHVTSEASGHDLHCFQALRRMDEILVANFMVFQEVVEEGCYDLVIGDEAWDVDYYWHENPELKRGQNVWLTDFVGYLPMPDGGEREAFLTTDYNAEMIEHIDRYPWIRDRAIFVGHHEDIVPDTFGGNLPAIRDWTTQHFSYSGYITGFTPPEPGEVASIRSQLGYRDDELVCVVAVGGSGVGRALIDKVVAAYPLAKKAVPELRMIVVTGPRIDPAVFPQRAGLELRGYVHRLHQHLCVCDLAIVQGGLTTTMELTAAKRPFLYFPLGHHFEQNFHVRQRLDRYGAGQCMDYTTTDPDLVAARITELAGKPVSYRDVETDGAARAAQLITELI